ncbi:MAG: hypothetical protein KKD94_04795 [Nanoarchaeota archaeon]|nr:hypothetical protein [Nanoarchaeota archaeon]MBU1988769.1 hypothetical protein [Nanoarchaeota archaeon]
MNKKAQGEEIVVYAVVFLVLFFIGGFIGSFSFPAFPGRFFICGLVLGAFGTGAGAFIIKVIFHK